ncbi:MAG: DUF3500 domain-containing protein [Verrucomicrobiota bacterium]
MKYVYSLLVVLVAAFFLVAAKGKANEEAKVAKAMEAAADAWIKTLDEAQMEKALMAFDDKERFNWAYVPREREGLTLKAMSEEQRGLARALLASALSERGLWKAETIIELERVLQEIEGPDRRFIRDPENYYFSIFGTPGNEDAWGWRFEGHHCSMNFTVVGGKLLADGPRFMGSNPAEVTFGDLKGVRVLGEEEDLGRALLKALDESQRARAIFRKEAYRDILTKTDRKVDPMKPEGIQASEFNEQQVGMLVSLISEYVATMPEDLAKERMAKLKEAGLNEVWFGWAGGTEPGQGHYYRVQGPTFLIEYDNVQNKAKHVHSVWRDFEGDFGRDLLREHYEAHRH